jgi:1,4-dihydroxy-2-naphthoate octaprenyltransferase
MVLIVGLIIAALEIAGTAAIAYFFQAYLDPLPLGVVSVLVILVAMAGFEANRIRQWNSDRDPTWQIPSVQLGARRYYRLSIVLFLGAEVYLIVFQGTVNPFF